ncbi:MAG: alanine--glyoxylate aminotransferase family protein [Candidatus Melainabacteria bacterium]|nr:MAG: alanine--glyoxylate aminotransferase family protein [Candidatus Melainabacteria bacterium]
MQPREFLMIPGPTPVPDAVLESVARHPIGHRTPEFSKVVQDVIQDLKWLGKTENDVFVLTASGTGGMEAAVSNTISPGDRVLSLICGVFGERWAKVAEAFGAEVERMTVEPGKAIDPKAVEAKLASAQPKFKAVTITHNETSTGVINDLQALAAAAKKHSALSVVDAVTSFGAVDLPIDAWDVDVVVTGSQKALMLPPGLGIIFFGKRAWEAKANCQSKSFYFDLKKYKKSLDANTTPYTPNVSLFCGLATALKMMREEGTESIFARHMRLKQSLRAGLQAMGLELVVDEEAASPTITSIKPPADLTVDAIRKKLKERYKILVADGQEELKGKIFRIGHMGYVFERDVLMTLASLEATLIELGHKVEPGKAVRSASDLLAARK